ncbi:hypothetical protein D3C79_356090 [compost metagenome]
MREITGGGIDQAHAEGQHAVGVRHVIVQFGARQVAAVAAHPACGGFRDNAFCRRHIGEWDRKFMCDVDN